MTTRWASPVIDSQAGEMPQVPEHARHADALANWLEEAIDKQDP